ncbi:MAG TPA: Nramp family divalent metal transporter [Solimonas sp.]
MKAASALLLFGPGLLLAATGVGAGDLATAAFAGGQLGTTVLWAAALGAALKFALNEGLARWQLATGQSFLEGVATRLGRVWLWLFLPYLLLWSYFVGAALISACGVAAQALWPLGTDAIAGKRIWGVVHALAGLALVWFGGFRVFEWAMRICIALMFVVVIGTAAQLWPGASVVAQGLWPRLPVSSQGLGWTLALIGGVGGTLTVLCYGYWIRAAGRHGVEALRVTRIDLAAGYAMTALFAMAMVLIGSRVPVSGSGATLIVDLGHALEAALGPGARWAFFIGAWGAMFSSLLGVWQAVPYLFADLCRVLGLARLNAAQLEGSRPYRGYLLALSLLPMLGLAFSFQSVQKLYAMIGALFIPVLALALLWMNGRRAWVGTQRNGPASVLALAGALLFFLGLALAGIAAG